MMSENKLYCNYIFDKNYARMLIIRQNEYIYMRDYIYIIKVSTVFKNRLKICVYHIYILKHR